MTETHSPAFSEIFQKDAIWTCFEKLSAKWRRSSGEADDKKGGEDRSRGLTVKPNVKEVKAKVFKFEATKEEKQWLEGGFIRLLKEEFSWELYGEEIRSESGKSLTLRYIGDNVVIINQSEEKDTKVVIQELDEWITHWFEWCRPWREKDVCHRRKVWTRWYGVPAHAWTLRFFKLASVNVGSFVKLDAISEKKKRLDMARVLISAPYLNDVNQIFEVDIEGELFKIKIVGEFDWSQDAIDVEKKGYQIGDEDDSCWSDESTYSFMLSLANGTEHGFSEEKTIGGDEAQSSPAPGRMVDLDAAVHVGDSRTRVGDTMSVMPTILEERNMSKSKGNGRESPREMGHALAENIDDESGPYHPVNEKLQFSNSDDASGHGKESIMCATEKTESNSEPYADNRSVEEANKYNKSFKKSGKGVGVLSKEWKTPSRTTKKCNRKTDNANWSRFVEDLTSEEDTEILEKEKKKQTLMKGKQKQRNDKKYTEAAATWSLGKKVGLTSGSTDKKMIDALIRLQEEDGCKGQQVEKETKLVNP
ncbi:hypothetical protein ACS0TY_007323 [Phlomoides rotata]